MAHQGDPTLTEHEGMLLALVVRRQPLTAYQLYKLFEQSPVSSINASKGQLYPAIRRLKEKGLLKASRISGDGRNSEELSVTAAGKSAVRSWTKAISPAHVVLDDPLRTRVLSFETLTREEQLEWIARAKELIKERREEVEAYNSSVTVPFQQFVYRSAVEVLRVRMEWLDELLYFVAKSS